MSSDSYPSLFGAWTRASSQLFTSVLEANRAAMTAFSPPQKPDVDADGRPTEERIAPDADLPEWDVELDADASGLAVGDVVRFTKTIAEADVQRFAAASGDTNPLHLDEEFARLESRTISSQARCRPPARTGSEQDFSNPSVLSLMNLTMSRYFLHVQLNSLVYALLTD